MRAASLKERRGELLLLLASVTFVLLALLALEALLRALDPRGLEAIDAGGLRRLIVYSEVYGWELRRNVHAEHDGVRVTVNGMGYRGREHSLVKSDGQKRVLVLGDSVAFGFDVGDEETFASLLESSLPGVEVVNLAVPGWGTDQELIRLEREGLRFRPDDVVLAFCLENDFIDNSRTTFFYDGVHPKPYFRLEGDQLVAESAHLRLSPAARLGLFLREHSALYDALAPAAPRRSQVDWRERKREALRNRDAAVALTFRLIARMEALARAAGARFLLVVFPDRDAFQGQEPLLEEFGTSRLPAGTTLVDMTPIDRAHHRHFRDFTVDSLGHLNRQGHRLAAETLRGLWRRQPEGRASARHL